MASRYLIGIDLGTTNSALAYIDTHTDPNEIRVFPIPQLVAHGEVQTLPGLPSFIYFPTKEELSSGDVSATWDEDPAMVTGVMAREQGALAPGRQVSSAKSWLSYAGANRRGKILPAQAEPLQPMISPVEASARYLMHLRDAWNATHPNAEEHLEAQDTVLTVPASFDEEARELTVEAAHRAKLDRLTLLEEPLAAFYAWIAADRGAESNLVSDGDVILICDVGGGTSDFSLIRARAENGAWEYERTAVGEHVLLGGDNLDLALAQLVQDKLSQKLSLRQRYALRRACSAAKERLLSEPSIERLPITILGSGTSVVAGALTVDLHRDEVLRTLADGFLPLTLPNEMPARGRSTGLRELGLPYAADPAITRHLSAFLSQAAVAMNVSNQALVRPDAVLFNGGFFTPAVAREYMLDAIAQWFSLPGAAWVPKLLVNEGVDSAVARGAAYYAQVRRGIGVRVRAGSARTYYIGLPSHDGLQAICVLTAGTQEGTTLPLSSRDFRVIANRPVSFPLYSSRLRHDAEGELVTLDESTVHHHAPLVTLLRFGKKLRDRELTVRLRSTFTELGTLELWCESQDSPHRWRLQFELRGEEPDELGAGARFAATSSAGRVALSTNTSLEPALANIREVFTGADTDPHLADTLMSQLETTLAIKRDAWPLATIRALAQALVEVSSGRERSVRHEVRWLNLIGFCLRPGFGAAGDQLLVRKASSIASKLAFAGDIPCETEYLVFLRRIAGGINASEQHALFRQYVQPLSAAISGKRKSRLNAQIEHETWRLVASLEQVSAGTRAKAGERLLERVVSTPDNAIFAWSLGRLGARIPLYGPLHSVIAPRIAERWVRSLIEIPDPPAAIAGAIVQIARRSGDASRDLDQELRELAKLGLSSTGIPLEQVQPLTNLIMPDRADAARSFGESLPPGLEISPSSNCLLPLSGLQSLSPADIQRPA